MFTILCEQYQISLNRDPCYRQYLDKIGQLFFNIPPPRPRNQGLFGSLLQSFFNGLEDDDSDDEQRNTASTSHAAQELDWLKVRQHCAVWSWIPNFYILFFDPNTFTDCTCVNRQWNFKLWTLCLQKKSWKNYCYLKK